MEERTRTDAELREIVGSYNESELAGLMFCLLPRDKTPRDLSTADVVRMMELNPKGCY